MDLANELGLLILGVIVAILPFVLVLMVVGVVTTIAQVGLKFTPAAMMPSLGKLNPLSGSPGLFSKRGLMELAKATVKIVIVGYVAYGVFSGLLRRAAPPERDWTWSAGSARWGAVATDLGKNTSGWLLGLGRGGLRLATPKLRRQPKDDEARSDG